MLDITTQQVEQVLAQYIDPYLKKDWLGLGFIKGMTIKEQLIIQVSLSYPAATIKEQLLASLSLLLQQSLDIPAPVIELDWKIQAYAVQAHVPNMAQVKNVIAVASGKGGVGKSTTAVNLALALAREGATVGLLDADIYGPSQPTMLGVHSKPQATDNKTMLPVMAHGLQTMSIGYLVEESTPMIWRGPMVTSALQQLLFQTEWQALDYLIIDLPPGTGDIQLSLAQKIPLTGAVIVTTPQDIALLDVRKAINMFNKVKVPVLGIVENMSTHTCSQCGHTEAIFGTGGGACMAEEFKLTLLGQLPLDRRIRMQLDQGVPTVVAEPEGDLAQQYREIGLQLAASLALRGKDYRKIFPKIVIEN